MSDEKKEELTEGEHSIIAIVESQKAELLNELSGIDLFKACSFVRFGKIHYIDPQVKPSKYDL